MPRLFGRAAIGIDGKRRRWAGQIRTEGAEGAVRGGIRARRRHRSSPRRAVAPKRPARGRPSAWCGRTGPGIVVDGPAARARVRRSQRGWRYGSAACTVPLFDGFMKRIHGSVPPSFERGFSRNRNGHARDEDRVSLSTGRPAWRGRTTQGMNETGETRGGRLPGKTGDRR